MYACVLSCFSHDWLFVTLWTIAHQTLLSMGFSRQENCRGLPCPPPGGFPNPGIELVSLTSPALAGGFFTTSATWTRGYLRLIHVDVWQKASQYFKVIILQLNKLIIYASSLDLCLVYACMLSHFSRVQFFVILWTIASQAPLSMGFSRQENEWVAMPSSKRSSQPRDRTSISYISCIGRQVLDH